MESRWGWALCTISIKHIMYVQNGALTKKRNCQKHIFGAAKCPHKCFLLSFLYLAFFFCVGECFICRFQVFLTKSVRKDMFCMFCLFWLFSRCFVFFDVFFLGHDHFAAKIMSRTGGSCPRRSPEVPGGPRRSPEVWGCFWFFTVPWMPLEISSRNIKKTCKNKKQ